MPENQTVWKSDNQEVKKETFIQTVGGVEMGSQGEEDSRQSGRQLEDQVRWQLAKQVVPHLHADKPGGTNGERDRPHNPGFQHGEKKPQYPWL